MKTEAVALAQEVMGLRGHPSVAFCREPNATWPLIVCPKILVVEEDAGDAFLLQCALNRVWLGAIASFVSDGIEAIEYLRGKELRRQVASSTLPQLLLLDLRKPRLDGLGVLEWLREHAHLRPQRVVVLSASMEERARVNALGADQFLIKPSTPAGFTTLLTELQEWYFRQILMPRSGNAPERHLPQARSGTGAGHAEFPQ